MVFDFIGQMIDPVFAPLAVFSPDVTIFIFSAMLTLLILFVNRLLVKKSFIEEIRTKMEQLKEKITQAQKEGNKEELQKFMGELMQTNNQYMKHNFKTLIVSLIVLSLLLPWLSYRYSAVIINIPFSLPFLGSQISWVYWYVLASFAVGWGARKVFGLGL